MKIAIFAVDKKGHFGNKDGSLPWKRPIKEDIAWFVEKTKDVGTIVMGVNTFRSLPKKLKDRRNVVVARPGTLITSLKARNGELPDLLITALPTSPFSVIDNKLDSFGVQDYAIIGGTSLLTSSISSKILDKVYMTVVESEYPSDIKFSLPSVESKIEHIYAKNSDRGKMLLYDISILRGDNVSD